MTRKLDELLQIYKAHAKVSKGVTDEMEDLTAEIYEVLDKKRVNEETLKKLKDIALTYHLFKYLFKLKPKKRKKKSKSKSKTKSKSKSKTKSKRKT